MQCDFYNPIEYAAITRLIWRNGMDLFIQTQLCSPWPGVGIDV